MNSTPPPPKQRHGCLTAFLYVGLFLSVIVISLTFLPLPSLAGETPPSLGENIYTFVLTLGFIVALMALLRWKRWGFWLYVSLDAANLIYGIALSLSSKDAAYFLDAVMTTTLSVGLLCLALHIGGERKGWTQLE